MLKDIYVKHENGNCHHQGDARLTNAGPGYLILGCYKCNRWCEVPANWFTTTRISLNIVTQP